MHTVKTATILNLSVSKKNELAFHPLESLLIWSDRQNNSRMLWSAVAITSLGCVFAPIATILVCLSGMSPMYIILAMLSMCVSLVVNLAALPTRITIPIFFLSVFIDLVIVVSALVTGCHFENIFTPY